MLDSARMYSFLILLAVAWGALAFGAVYPWAYRPLLALVMLLGVWGLVVPGRYGQRSTNKPIAVACGLLILAVLVQLVPLPHDLLAAVSPAADRYLRGHQIGYAILVSAGQSISHPLSIDPARTWLGLALLVGLALFVLGVARALDGVQIRQLASGLIVLGAVLAIVGITQKVAYNGKIYWFWTPIATSFTPFGPFVNRNHFAGWMLMALPLGLGFFIGLVMRGMRGINSGWRSRIGWFATADASRIVLVAMGILVMTLSFVMTFSRSGITCFMVALLLAGAVVVRRAIGRAQRAVIVVFLCALAVAAVWSVGLDPLALRFDFTDREVDMRLGAWRDALSVARRYPVFGTGLDTYGVSMSAYQTYRVDTLHFAEAHDDYLQLLAEGGVLLAVPAVVVIALFVREVRHRFRERLDDLTGYWIRVGAVTGVVAIGLQELVDFSLQMPGNAALFALLCAIAVRRASGRASPRAAP